MHKAFGISCSKSSQTTGTTINKIQHPFCQDRFLHFMFDVPHLIKNLKSSIVSGNIITLSNEIVEKFQLKSANVSLAPIKNLIDFIIDYPH